MAEKPQTVDSKSRRTTTVLLVEDSETDRELFAAQLPTDGPLRCRMTFARTLAAALATLGNEKTDVIVLDLNLPDSTGLETCRNVHSAAPDVPIVVLTGMDDEELGVAAVAAGAQDYLVKGTYDDYLLARAIRFALKRAQHRRAESRQHGRPEKDAAVALRLDRLTPREREVCDLLVQGSTAKHVAVQLDISVQTVAKHRARILEKMNVNNDVELVRRILGRDRARG